MKYIPLFFLLLTFCSCKESNRSRITRLVKEWEGKEISFPENVVFTRLGLDTLNYQLPETDYTVVSYIDSTGCTSCKLQFHRWKYLMHEMDSVSGSSIPFLFVFHPKNKRDFSELTYLMKRDHFDYPVWIDLGDRFNKMNKFPAENIFHSLLIDKENKVIAMGDPFQNHQIRELYLKIINEGYALKSSLNQNALTKVHLTKLAIDLGEFDWKESQKISFILTNKGQNHLVIHDIVTSCGCIALDYPKTPVEPNKDLLVSMTYKSEKPEYINKTLIVHANVKEPLRITISGNAH